MQKIRFTCDWCDDVSLRQRFVKCYTSRLHPINFEITVDEDYDILVSINKPVYTRHRQCIYVGVLMEPSWYLGECRKDEIYSTNDYVISYTDKSRYKNNIFYPGVLPFHVTYNSGSGLDYYINNCFKKTKNCSIIVSRDKVSHDNRVLYKARVDIAEEILKTDLPIDIFGKGWDSYIGRDSRIKGSLDIEEKYKGLADYKFSVCIENCSEASYFTEKITDCILTNTIPVYYGCEHITDFFRSVVPLKSIKTDQVIKEFYDILFKQEKQFYQEDKLLLANKFNLFVALSKLVSHLYN